MTDAELIQTDIEAFEAAIEARQNKLERLMERAESGEQWAEICCLRGRACSTFPKSDGKRALIEFGVGA
jgi:hypothetical protein